MSDGKEDSFKELPKRFHFLLCNSLAYFSVPKLIILIVDNQDSLLLEGEAMFVSAVLADALGGLIVTLVIALYKKLRGENNWYKEWSRRILITFVVSTLVIAATDLTPVPLGETLRVSLFPNSLPDNERWTFDAWYAFERGDYLSAIRLANQVIDLYAGSAERQQAQLKERGEPEPSTGKIWPWPASKIFARGVLNDVASCYWIAGRSYEMLRENCEAKAAFVAASELTYARTHDPQWWPLRGWSPFGWFWSPAELAQDRITKLSCP